MRLATLGATLVAALALAPSAWADTELPLCTAMVSINCVVSVKVEGVATEYPSDGDPYEISIRELDVGAGAAYDYNVLVYGPGGAALPVGEEWEIALNLGSTFPGETFSRGRNVNVVRGGTATSRTLTATLEPVRLADQGCSSSGVCVPTAGRLITGYLELWISDLSYVTDPDDRAAMSGFDLASSAEWISSPLTLDYATHAIVLDVANSHWEPGGSTLFVGSAQFRLPFPMLSRLYDVDDPASLTPAAFAVTAASGPAPTVTVAVGTGEVDVTMENLTFSKRRVRIRGDVRPGLPRQLRARRTTSTAGAIWFMKALPRGAKVRGYQAVCRAGSHVVRGSTAASPVRLRGLTAARYSCTLQAKSKAGLGRIARASIPRR